MSEPSMNGTAEVVDFPEGSRFEIRVGGEVAGMAVYRLRRDAIVFLHTEIGDAYEGQGLGGVLVRAALDSARERGLRVVPSCPFVRGWIERHPDYADLVRPPAHPGGPEIVGGGS